MTLHAGLDRQYLPVDLPPAAWPDGTWATARHMALSAEAATLLDDLRHAMERNPEAARAAALRLATFLALPAAVSPAGARGGLAPWQKRKLDRYLRAHVGQTIRLEDLAAQVPLSVSHFCRAFKESFGTTPHMYIIRLRLALAQRLMLTTDDSLSQIALACGLSDQAHLSKLFRRVLGETPSAWRRLNMSEPVMEARRAPRSAPENHGNSRQAPFDRRL